MYAAGRLAAAEAVHSGITFVHDWCHNVRGPDYAEAALRALAETGIRARFSYGSPTGASNDASIDLRDLTRLREGWNDHSNGGLLTLGLAWRGAASAATVRDYEVAKELRLPISVHANNFQSSARRHRSSSRTRGLLASGHAGDSRGLVHAARRFVRSPTTRVNVSVSPYSEMRIGFGMPDRCAAARRRTSTSGCRSTRRRSRGNADMFAIMKAIQNIENGRARDEFKLTARRVLELATIDGARSMGLGDSRRLVDAGQARRPHHGRHARRESRPCSPSPRTCSSRRRSPRTSIPS